MARPDAKGRKEKDGSSSLPAPAPPKTPWELVIALLWNPPWKRWGILMPLLVTAAVLNLVGQDQLMAMAQEAGVFPSDEIQCWTRTLRPADSHIAGMRIVKRSTSLDLTHWEPASADDIAKQVPVELAISRNTFLIERTDINQGCFIHRISTSSGIEPEVHCNRCHKVALPRKEGSPVREWDVVFDIQKQPVGPMFSIVFSVDFWNSFQRPDQWWGGFRILHSTEVATYTINFPEAKRPRPGSLQPRFVRSTSQIPEPVDPNLSSLRLHEQNAQVEHVVWTVRNPQPDRSYRIYWVW